MGRNFGSAGLPGARGEPDQESVVDKRDDAGALHDDLERVVVARSQEGGRNRALWPEQKSVSWVNELLVEWAMKQLMIDPWARALSAAKACMMLPSTNAFRVQD